MAPDMYYDRTMIQPLEDLVLQDYQWLIDAVKSNPELDFQTGNSWFSVYRGTGRIMTINPKGKIFADSKYMNLCPEFYKAPDLRGLETLLLKIHDDHTLNRYYMDDKGKKKEGFYQNLISRRYSLHCRPDDDFIIIDKEFVLGYLSDKKKEEITTPIQNNYDKIISFLAGKYPFFKDIKQPGTECDLVGLTKQGDILLLEVKRHDDYKKVYLSPLQASKYDDLTKEYARRYPEHFSKNVISMISQKVKMGILCPKWVIPSALSGKIYPAVVVGGNVSTEVQRRFGIARDAVGKDIPLYTCDANGTLIKLL